MLRTVYTSIALISLCGKCASAQTEWVAQFGTASADSVTSIALDSSSLYVAGFTEGAFPGQTRSGNSDAFLARYDRDGNRLWIAQFGATGFYQGKSVAVDPTGIYIAAYSSFGSLLRKYSSAGTLLWSRSIAWSLSTVAVGGGAVYAAGYISDQTVNGGPDAFVQKFNTNGDLLWSRQFDTPGWDLAVSLATSGAFLYVAGSTTGALPGFTNAGEYDTFLRKYDDSGNLLWTRQFGSADHDFPYTVAADATGIYLDGSHANTEAVLRKFGHDGSLLWARFFGGGPMNPARGALSGDAYYVLASINGTLTGQTGAGDWDVVIRKYNLDGTELWTRQLGSPGAEFSGQLAADGSSIYVSGSTHGQFIGQSTLGPLDGFLMRLNPGGVPAPPALRFIPLSPCRLIDTRVGQRSLNAGEVRTIGVVQGPCGIPADAQAYSINATVVPQEPLGYLTLWPTGSLPPVASTLNSFHGGIVANAALVRAGTGGAINAFVTNRTDLILDINGYFVDRPGAFSFYTVEPCRVADTRVALPILAAGETRSFVPPNSGCRIPGWATAYSLNATVVPAGGLSFLTLWPAGNQRPLASVLNSFDGTVVANAAIVQGPAVNAFVTDSTHLILDTNGYFGPPGGPGELRFFPLLPCRVADTRLPGTGLQNGETRDFVVGGTCGVPAGAKAYALNVTVSPVPTGLAYLTLWPSGSSRPLVSTLNSWLGRVLANAAIVPAGHNGSVSIFAAGATHVILDVNGYFQ